ncbi:MAG: hypothetical protein KDI90_00420 [Alphaproteobacteria bacterium]|nr:hypothetical protein [Alphaproteobacteria bacterium]MCB9974646.1 hypothetical protein [Rhodospirillales bacterium]
MGWKERLLKWFEADESAFSRLQSRTITLDDHPDNVAVFEAVSLTEACLKADAAMRRPEIQGAIWVRNEREPFLKERMGAVTNLREKAETQVFDGEYLRKPNGVSLQTDMIRQKDGAYKPKFESYSKVTAEEIIEPERLAELKELSTLFAATTLNCRYQMTEHIDPHYDYFTNDPLADIQEDRLFLGRPLRILVSRHQATTIIYNTLGEYPESLRGGNIRGRWREKLAEAWQPAVGDYVFQCNLRWGNDKALPHSPPEFSTEDEADCRIIDIYDVSEGQDLSGIQPEDISTEPV